MKENTWTLSHKVITKGAERRFFSVCHTRVR
jgi:hypothetical protein